MSPAHEHAPAALLPQALALHQAGRLTEAAALYERILASQPEHAEALQLAGTLAAQQGDHPRAIALLTEALRLNPNHAAGHLNRGVALKKAGQPDAALTDYERALTLQPDYTDAWYNRGMLLEELGRDDDAVASYDRAIALRPGFVDAWNHRGRALKERLLLDEAIASHAQAIALRPDHAAAHWNLAACELLRGNFARGWPLHEWRLREGVIAPGDRRDFRAPRWPDAMQDTNLAGKTLLLHAEQGHGDTLQFCRYAPHVAALGARVVLEVQPPLAGLLASLEGVAQVVARGDMLPAFDGHCPLMSLPLAFGTTPETIPAAPRYLRADPHKIAAWQIRCGPKTKPRIGLAWSGNAGHWNDRRRSLPLAGLAPLLSLDYEFFCLQKDIRPADEAPLQTHPALRHFGAALEDFSDSAALCELMDLVISVDTSIAHLAGALGKPVWIMLPFSPDWRWLLDRDDSPWYPTAKLYRQEKIDDWAGVIVRISADLTKRAALNNKDAEVSRLFPQAFALHQQDRYSEAATLYEQILAVQPGHFEATQLRGVLAAQIGDYQRALAFLTDALKIRPDHAPTYNNRGIIFKELGQTDAAVNDYRHAIECKPDWAEAHNNLGVALQALRQFDAAVASHDQAIRIQPDFAEAWLNRGNALKKLAQPDAAIACYDRAIAIKADYAAAYLNRGAALQDLRRIDAAVTDYNSAIACSENFAEAYNNLGVALQALLQPKAAIASYDRAIAIRPDYAEAFYNRGNALIELDQPDAAVTSYDKAITIQPNYAEAWYNRGNALMKQKQPDVAISSYEQAIVIRSDYVDAFNNRGNALKECGELDKAISDYDRAIAIQPNHADAYINRGNAQKERGELDKAIADYDRAIAINPDHAEVWYNRGNALKELRQTEAAIASLSRAIELSAGNVDALISRGAIFQEILQLAAAEDDYRRAIAIRPDFAAAHWNIGFINLLRGNFASGWSNYEWRWKADSSGITEFRNFPQPLWLGAEPLAGKTILLHAEQGLGDTLQFCRYARMVADLDAHVIMEVQRPLAALLTDVEGVSQLVAKGDRLPPFDYQCPLLSLPLAFETDLQSIPVSIRYIRNDPSKVARWQVRLGNKTRPRIGIAWSGSTGHSNDHNRSMALADLVPLLSMDSEFEFVSLQKEVRESDREALQHDHHLRHFGAALEDFSDSAALCELMDLVISVDTSIAHLAGALGKPVWIMLPFSPDWRWLLDRDDSPWYPSAQLYRQQTVGDWAGVVDRIRTNLARILPEGSQ